MADSASETSSSRKSPARAPAKAAADGGEAATPERRRRRLPALAWGTLGAAVATGYAFLVMKMRPGPPLVMVGLGGLTLVLGAIALWRVIDPLTRAEVADAPKKQSPYRIRELEREKQVVLKAIKEIELDHQMRKISDTDYQEMVERYRARALRVMGDLAAGDDYRALIERELKDRLAASRASAVAATGATEATAAGGDRPAKDVSVTAQARAARPDERSSGGEAAATVGEAQDATSSVPEKRCPACATVNDDDARFCKSCGHALASS